MIRKLLVSYLFFVTYALSNAADASIDVMPLPQHFEFNGFRLPIGKTLTVHYTQISSERLRLASNRLLTAWQPRLTQELKLIEVPDNKSELLIDCGALSSNIPEVQQDESYKIEINSKQAVLHATNEVGVLRGLSTLQQLLANDVQGWYLPGIVITDSPRFAWRGLLIDTGRHFMPVEVIHRNLDAMALVKLNVLHFHLTEDQGFRIEVKRHPELTGLGSDGKYYTQDQIKEIVSYAADRGIRVVPELDMPAHSVSWLVSHPELSSGPDPVLLERHWGGFDPVFDPTNEAVYSFINDVFSEVTALFPDPYFHIGGDENNGVQWSKSVSIKTFIQEHGLKNNAGLQTYFNQRVGKILEGYNKKMIGWDEILNPNLPRGNVIETWRGEEGIGQATRQGYDVIRAHDYYIDYFYTAEKHYKVDPEPDASLGRSGHVLGGEATAWSEFMSDQNIDSRIWPRTAAIAERFWSKGSVRDIQDMYRRLEIIDIRLDECGTIQNKFVRPALLHLLGSDRSTAPLDILENFFNACEPVYGKRTAINSMTPLNGISDIARPDGKVQRHFSSKVNDYINSSSYGGPSSYSIMLYLLKWKGSASLVLKLANTSPALADAAPLAYQLNDASSLGLDAINYIKRSQPASATWKAKALKRLKLDSEIHGSVQLAIIGSISKLVNAVTIEKK
jgi:hexosaminidase